MINFTEIDINDINENEFNSFEDKLIYQTLPWIRFILKTQNVKLILLKIEENDTFIGFYTGFLFKKFGVKIIGSPFRGWTTLYMGFNLKNGINRVKIINPLWTYLKKKYHCMYMEIIDRYITPEEAQKQGLRFDLQETYIKDISGNIDDIYKSFSSTCKNQIKRYEKNDAVFKVCEPSAEFAEKYYEQLIAVFGYQDLIPTYDVDRVKKLFLSLKSMVDGVYCTEMCNPEGKSVGTLIGFAYNKTCYLFGLASYREEKYYQADYLVWDSFVHWKSLGYEQYDLVGVREYKLKFHPELLSVPRIICCKFKVLIWGRNLAQKLYWKINAIKGKKKR